MWPRKEIIGRDGQDVYMTRWHLIPNRLYLHKMSRPDMDPWLHDHPFSFRSFVLWGGYVEERFALPRDQWEQEAKVTEFTSVAALSKGLLEIIRWPPGSHGARNQIGRRWLSTFRVTPETPHRIIRLLGKGATWTLVFRGRKTTEWGFWVDDHDGARKIHWQVYTGETGEPAAQKGAQYA